MTYGSEIFVAVGHDETILTSKDGVSWTQVRTGTYNLNNVIYKNGLFLSSGTDGRTLNSSDGQRWKIMTPEIKFDLFGVSYGKREFVFVGENGTVRTSPDGIGWTSRTSGTSNRLNGVTYKEEPQKKVEPVVVEKKVTIPKVEPKVVVEKKVEEPIVVVEKNGKGVLYKNKGNGTWFDKSSTRYKSGYWEKKDGKYVGDVENGKPNGLGILIFPDGRKYVGEFKYGNWNGQGTYTYPDGSKEVGEWKSGQPWNVKGYDKNGNITEKYVNGKWIKQ